MVDVGDRVRIHRPRTALDGATGEVVRIDVIPPTPGVASGHLRISRLFTVRLDDGTLVQPPLLISDLFRISRCSRVAGGLAAPPYAEEHRQRMAGSRLGDRL